MTFSQKLKTAMENLNLRQVDVANLTGKGKNAISQYIAGKNIPKEKTRKEMAAALGLNENYFETDIPIVKVLKNDYVIAQISVENAASVMRLSVETMRKGLQQRVFCWGYAIKVSSKWRYFINAKRFAEVEGVEVPADMIF